DTAGPMARTVTDAAILLSAMTGEDSHDPATAASAGHAHRDYTQFLDANGLRGARLGVARKLFSNFHPAVHPMMESLLAQMKRLGAELIDPVELSMTPELDRAESEVLHYEFKAGLNAYLAALGPAAPVRTLKDVIEFNERHREREMPWFGQEHFLKAEAKGPLTEKAYLDALATCRRLARREGIDAIMDRHRLDALVTASDGPADVIDYVHGGRDTGYTTWAAAVAGYPSITVPGGQVLGLPVGVTFFGRAWSEPKLLRIAFAFEQATRARRPPRFLPGVQSQRPPGEREA
ncbi:MAG: amidase, partial [Pedosphaera parvula]|nr:amidase [Pedosphaera parvula]